MPEPITTFSASPVPLLRDDIDTDQIIPARFLKGTEKTGLGRVLFHDWRFKPDGTPDPGFPLNQPQYQQAGILMAQHNFGCGSSREHAPWALKDYGFKAIVAISFADIFKNNALKNGLLPIAISEQILTEWLAAVEANPALRFNIDVAKRHISLEGSVVAIGFELDAFRQRCLLEGVDELGYTLSKQEAIARYEADHDRRQTKLINA